MYACDGEWWTVYIDEVRRVFLGELWTQDERAGADYSLFQIPAHGSPGLGKGRIHTGENSGYQAINLAYLFGATRIILIGFDMQRTGGMCHWHGKHPGNLNRHSPLEKFAKNFDALAKDLKNEGVEVLNATRETALNCFEKINLEDAIC